MVDYDYILNKYIKRIDPEVIVTQLLTPYQEDDTQVRVDIDKIKQGAINYAKVIHGKSVATQVRQNVSDYDVALGVAKRVNEHTPYHAEIKIRHNWDDCARYPLKTRLKVIVDKTNKGADTNDNR